MLERLFHLGEHGTDVRTEVEAGVTTFLTMAYILAVNPLILAEAGVPIEGALFATAVAAAVGCLLMGFLANYPFALAPGMGLNAYFTYSVVLGMGVPWQTALGAVFISGLVFLVLTLARIRELAIRAIPMGLKLATGAGIGLFIAFIGLKNAGVVVASPATFVTLGQLASLPVALALLGLVLTGALMARRWKSAIIVGIVATAAAAYLLGVAQPPKGIVAIPDAGSTFLAMDVRGALGLGLLHVVFVFFFVDLFDTVGTLVGLGHQAGYLTPEGELPRANRALLADSLATVTGAALGTSTVTSYIESATGVAEGGAHGAHRGHHGCPLPAGRLSLPAGGGNSGHRHGPRADRGGEPDAAGRAGGGLGRPHRGHPRLPDAAGNAAHLLHRQRAGARLHLVSADEAPGRARARGEPAGVRAGRALRAALRLPGGGVRPGRLPLPAAHRPHHPPAFRRLAR